MATGMAAAFAVLPLLFKPFYSDWSSPARQMNAFGLQSNVMSDDNSWANHMLHTLCTAVLAEN
jgi:hypothetical protein